MLSWVVTVGKLFKRASEDCFSPADDSKATVRLFKIGKDSYVMAHELLQSMKNKNMDVSEFEEEVLKMTNLAAFNFREVAQKVKIENMKNIEFIRINIREFSITSIPIPAPDGKYCVPATDGLLNLISDIIVAKKVLQRINRDQFKHIQQFFKSVEHIFPVEGGDYFISLDDAEWMKAKWEETYEENLKSSAAVKHIRKVRKGGFTEDDLDKELEYLNLYNCFPGMKREVERAYKFVTEDRNITLKLEDMHSSVLQCQMTILLENLPNVHKYLHSQKLCTTWLPYLGCVLCESSTLPTLKKHQKKPSPTREEVKEMIETSTVSVVPPPRKDSDVVMEEKNPEDSPELHKKKRSRKTKKSEESTQSTSESSSSLETEMSETSTLPTLEKLLKESSPTREEVKEMIEMTTVSVVPPPPPKETDVIVEEKDQEVSSDVPKKKRSRKTKKSEASNQSTSESASSPEPETPEASKESQSCSKCFRASNFADVANEKLRLTKVECKHLKKELANAELEVEIQKEKGLDKDERIRFLEEILKSKDDIIERQNMDLLEKQNVIMNFEMEMESKDQIIQENSTTIKNLEKSLAEKEDQSAEVIITEPTRSDEKTKKAKEIHFKLLEIQGTLRSGNPIGKCRELGHRLTMNAKNKDIENATRVEVYRFCEQAKTYIRAVDSQLKMICGSHRTKPEEIPELPEFPTLSQGFREAYKDVVKSDAPNICLTLLKTPEVRPGELADTACLICIDEMESEEGTIKCECCKRRYHTKCAQEWFKTKRTCPTCSSALLDDSEFPPLGRR
ncbi:unnamed protein product [Caenorhabditis nigoni]